MRSDLAGRLQVHAVESLLTQAFLHDLKAEAWPLSREAPLPVPHVCPVTLDEVLAEAE